MSRLKRQLVTHTFKGPRFEDHGLDLDVLPELYAYKELLVAAAKELWRRHHPDRRLHVRGLAEFSPEGKPLTITEIRALTIQAAGEPGFDESARPIWEVIAELGETVSNQDWAKVPEDGAANLDHYLYGHAKRKE